MGKPIIYSAALVIYNGDRSKFFLTRRPLNDDSMPGYWGFPASSKKSPAEPWEDIVHRAAKIKLGVDVKIIKMLGEDTIDRGKYNLILRDYEVEIISGEPKVPQDVSGVTQYIDQRWTAEVADLQQAARDGSLCARVFLRANNIDW